MRVAAGKSPLASGLPWGIYLAASWTWCIGMFLPVLLLRDFGWAGFVVFALPNCLGAAAMAWVLARKGSSEAFLEAHGTAVRLFSLVTFVFHVVWLARVAAPLASVGGVRDLAVLGMFLPFVFAFAGGPRAAAGVYLLSLAAMGVWVSRASGVQLTAEEAAGMAAARLPSVHLLGLIPVCVFGFALCPYLDATFHKARQSLDERAAKVAFGTGFLLFFAAMIVLTTMYAVLFAHNFGQGPRPTRIVVALVAMHMVVQAGFTMGVHLRYLLMHSSGGRGSGWAMAGIAVLFVVTMSLVSPRFSIGLPPVVSAAGSDGLQWYRIFMGFYGLVFPAYVWICGWGRHGVNDEAQSAFGLSMGEGFARPSVDQVKVWVIACLIASPLMYYGFVEHRTLLLIPAMALVIAARWMVKGTAKSID